MEWIRISDETYAVLDDLKQDDETFDELLSRIVETRREQIRTGAGQWNDTDAPKRARATRDELKRDLGRNR